MNEFFKKNFKIPHIVGIVVGAILGFAYYYYIGCVSGTCAIKSNPYLMILYGALIGYFVTDFLWIMIKKLKKDSDK
ncbi:MAG: DUF6132 family protein [Bacteroidales bacterium]|nr:DUF6132 family protein [Bacteroidales bacterium]